MNSRFSRRDMLKGTGASLAMLGVSSGLAQSTSLPTEETATDKLQNDTRAARMQWWHAAKFGMFIHFGVYSTIGRHEWVMENEAWTQEIGSSDVSNEIARILKVGQKPIRRTLVQLRLFSDSFELEPIS